MIRILVAAGILLFTLYYLINNPSNQLETNSALTAQKEAEKVEAIMNQRADELKAQLQSQQAP